MLGSNSFILVFWIIYFRKDDYISNMHVIRRRSVVQKRNIMKKLINYRKV